MPLFKRSDVVFARLVALNDGFTAGDARVALVSSK